MEIAAGRAVSVDVHAGAAIRVMSGRIWLTQEDDPRDYAVPAGFTFCTDRSGRAVFSAIDGASVVVVIPGAGCVPGTLKIDAMEHLTREARRAQARYVGDVVVRFVKWLAASIRSRRSCRRAAMRMP